MQTHRFHISGHATRRMAQRNLKIDDIALVLRYGRCIHRTGARFYFLGRRDIPEGMEGRLEPLVGTTVIAEGGQITTVYRNRRGLAKIKHKSKRMRRSAAEYSSRGLEAQHVR